MKMGDMRNFLAAAAVVALAAAGCSQQTDEKTKTASKEIEVYEMPPAEVVVDKKAIPSFEEFKATVYKEPFPGGVYIVNGDTPIATDEDLENFYSNVVALKFEANYDTAIVIDAPGGRIAGWTDGKQKALSYCVSRAFGERYAAVAETMRQAAAAWEAVADVRFVHDQTADANCNAANGAVVFDVRPVDVEGRYYARAFFPRNARPERNILIDASSFRLNPADKLQLAGILRHELGHVLGFRHEHTRPEAGACFEDADWKPVGDGNYDAFSVMHYPQCNGLGDWSLTLTDGDKLGAACFYGSVPGSPFDRERCLPLSKRLSVPNAKPYTADVNALK